ncbi:VCBS repeat-containing protein [Sulfitobacter sp. HNIBRBA2951]|uniref:FG-GAP repeat domain-containing protein n=1 Tax=Sulfitobacter aquimarinus TaxID=3158557 RepID=UPI0032DEDEC3
MTTGARRLTRCVWPRAVRRVRHSLCVVLVLLVPVAAAAETITSARYTEPTTRYAHGVLGDAVEHGALEIETKNNSGDALSSDTKDRNTRYVLRLPVERVFEDTQPRLADVDGDGKPEVIVVESHQNFGARLAVYTYKRLLAATPYIGTRNRWLAPIGIADMDGDGRIELAYIDRPHLAKTLRVWRFANGDLTEVATLGNLTNHRIGERDIAGGLRDCGSGTEMIVARADWQRLMAVTFDGKSLKARDIGGHTNRDSFAAALGCK